MYQDLQAKIKTLNGLMWDGRLTWGDVERWLDNFSPTPPTGFDERLHALFLLSHFSYFNSTLMRELLRAHYRDLVQHPIVTAVRRQNKDTLDWNTLKPHFEAALKRIRFIGIGNPSESGTHLLYFFRQENKLPIDIFIYAHELFTDAAHTQLISDCDHVIFLDDLCGSGTQAARYSKTLLKQIRALSTSLRLSYLPLFATTNGLDYLRSNSLFDCVEALCELDDSFRSLESTSRYFREFRPDIDRPFARAMCLNHGTQIEPGQALGYRDAQLLLGFAHNVPDNTLPIFWSEGQLSAPWNPIFRRYQKDEGW